MRQPAWWARLGALVLVFNFNFVDLAPTPVDILPQAAPTLRFAVPRRQWREGDERKNHKAWRRSSNDKLKPSDDGHSVTSWWWTPIASLALVPTFFSIFRSYIHFRNEAEAPWCTVSLLSRPSSPRGPCRRAPTKLRAYENYLPDRLDPAVRKYWELEDPVDINGQMVDLHDWVTLPWDADWYQDDTEGEYVDPPEREPRPPPEPFSRADLRAEAFFDERRAEEQRLWDEARADIGLIVPVSMRDDYRIKGDGEWDEGTPTKEEVEELIGPIPNPSPLQVLNPFRTVQHDEGDPDGPDTMIDWMRSEGLLLEDGYSSDEEYEEGDSAEPDEEPEKWIGDATLKWMARQEAGEDEIIGDDDDGEAEPTATPQDVERFERGRDDYDEFLQGPDDGGFD